MTLHYGRVNDIPRPHPMARRYSDGEPAIRVTLQCPLCGAPNPTKHITSTDIRVCGDCIDGIPTNMHVPEVPA